MSSSDLHAVRYGRMRWNTPLSEAHAAFLLDRLAVEPGMTVLDVGCGWGELLLRAVTSGATGTGVDIDDQALERGRASARERGLDGSVRFVCAPADTWAEPADRVLCTGASHAWGGTDQALTSLSRLVPPGGRLLFGDGFWASAPTEAAQTIFGEGITDLTAVADAAIAGGWRVRHLSTADPREWDDFESTWRAGREDWLVDNPDHEDAGDVRADLDGRLKEYLTVYRGVLGFCYLVLSR